MATSKDLVEDLLERLSSLDVRARAMFGEYVVYCDEKVVLMLCDDRVFLKPTVAAEPFADRLEHAPPFPGAKDHLLLDERFLADRRRLSALVQASADARPAPKPRRRRSKGGAHKKA